MNSAIPRRRLQRVYPNGLPKTPDKKDSIRMRVCLEGNIPTLQGIDLPESMRRFFFEWALGDDRLTLWRRPTEFPDLEAFNHYVTVATVGYDDPPPPLPWKMEKQGKYVRLQAHGRVLGVIPLADIQTIARTVA